MPPSARIRTLLDRQVDLRAFPAWVGRHKMPILIAVGIVFRVGEYLSNRTYWMDEMTLSSSIQNSLSAGFFAPLIRTQLAPPGFLAIERVALVVLGDSRYSLRLYPLLCGVASLFLFRAVARRCLRPDAAVVAMALFALSEDLIYFSSELKQYGPDVAAALACLLLALRATSPRRLLALAAWGVVVVWFSHPSAFVLGGVGLVLIASAARKKDWSRLAVCVAACLAWSISVLVVRRVSMAHLGDHRGMWAFWDFAFPPLPPRSLRDLLWPARRILYLFVNPLDFHTPLGPRLSALPPFVLFVVGFVSMSRRDPRTLGLLMIPGLLALIAAYMKTYPFHGRLVLFLVPSLLLLIAEGAGVARERIRSRVLWILLLASLLLFPTLRDFYQLIEPHSSRAFTPHGDLRPLSLDPDTFPF